MHECVAKATDQVGIPRQVHVRHAGKVIAAISKPVSTMTEYGTKDTVTKKINVDYCVHSIPFNMANILFVPFCAFF